LTPRLRIMLARSSAHYDKELLRDVLWQNHVNGAIFEVVLVLSFIALGAFSDIRFFAIPAGASVFLFLTMVLMVISALFSWLQGWTGTVIILFVIGLNLLSQYAPNGSCTTTKPMAWTIPVHRPRTTGPRSPPWPLDTTAAASVMRRP
jgi:hypothetical protein